MSSQRHGHNDQAGQHLKYAPAPGQEHTHSVCRDCDTTLSNSGRVIAAHNKRCRRKRYHGDNAGKHKTVFPRDRRDDT